MTNLTPVQRLKIFLQAITREGLIQQESAGTNSQKYTNSVDRMERLLGSALLVAEPTEHSTYDFVQFANGARDAIANLKAHSSYNPEYSVNSVTTTIAE